MFAALLIVLSLTGLAWYGAAMGLTFWLGIVLPLGALALCAGGCLVRVCIWALLPVPFAIPLTGGQVRLRGSSTSAYWDAPVTNLGLAGRMFLEICCFRSLLRQTCAVEHAALPQQVPLIAQYLRPWLWLCALCFHYALLVTIIRHFRLFLSPVPAWIATVQSWDTLLELGLPRLHVSAVLLCAALFGLLTRRAVSTRLRGLSLPVDYLLPLLLLAVAGSGLCMTQITGLDTTQAKTYIMGMLCLAPVAGTGLPPVFFVHLALTSCLLIVLPCSKLTHMLGLFFSPTRGMRCDTRAHRHVNPWRTGTPSAMERAASYPAYEARFHDVMTAAGLPLDAAPVHAETETAS